LCTVPLTLRSNHRVLDVGFYWEKTGTLIIKVSTNKNFQKIHFIFVLRYGMISKVKMGDFDENIT